MEENVSNLRDLLKNLKKSPGRTYTEKTIQNKLEIIESIRKDFDSNELEETDKEKIAALRIEFNSICSKIKEYLIESPKELEEKLITMAAFSLETTSKALPLFNGNYVELESFLITAELINKTLSNEAKVDFIQYVYYAKLTSNVRTALGTSRKPGNFETLKTLLQNRYRSRETITELQNKLQKLSQGKMSVNSFTEKIMNIIDSLNQLGIKELGNEASEPEKNVIIRLNNKLALDTFKIGLNECFKSTIYAARPNNIQEANELALELENEQKARNDSILHVRTEKHRTNTIMQKCKKCGGKHGSRCPAFGVKCHNCGKFNHFSKWCLTKITSTNNMNSNNPNNYNNRITNNRTNDRYNNVRRNTDQRRWDNNRNRNYRINQIEDQGNLQIPEVSQMVPPMGTY